MQAAHLRNNFNYVFRRYLLKKDAEALYKELPRPEPIKFGEKVIKQTRFDDNVDDLDFESLIINSADEINDILNVVYNLVQMEFDPKMSNKNNPLGSIV